MNINTISFTEFKSISDHALRNAIQIANAKEALEYKKICMKDASPAKTDKPKKELKKEVKESVVSAVSCSSAILAEVGKAKKPLTNSELRERLAKSYQFTSNNVGVTLGKLSKTNEIVRTGEYGAYLYSAAPKVVVDKIV